MDINEARQIVARYHPPLGQVPKAMQKALDVHPEPKKRNRKRRARNRRYTPSRDEVRRCVNQKTGVHLEE